MKKCIVEWMNEKYQEMKVPVSDGKGGLRYVNSGVEIRLTETEIEILENAVAQDVVDKQPSKIHTTPEQTGLSAFKFKPIKRFSVKVLEDADERIMKKNNKLETENENLRRELDAMKKSQAKYNKREVKNEVSDDSGNSGESTI